MQSVAPQFSRATQEDAQEFLSYLLDTIHEDLNRAPKGDPVLYRGKLEPVKDIHSSMTDMEETAKTSWKNHLVNNKSIIVDIFQGQIRSALTCNGCKVTTDSFDPIMYVSLPFPEERTKNPEVLLTLEDMLTEYTKVENLDDPISCGRCNNRQTASKKIDIWKSPNILILHLKRFRYGADGAEKIQNKVTFGIENLDITKFVKGIHVNKSNYNLFAVCVSGLLTKNHVGTLEIGHYYTFTKNFANDKWYVIDDEIFGIVEDQEAV